MNFKDIIPTEIKKINSRIKHPLFPVAS